MPRRARPGDRQRMETELGVAALETMRELAELMDGFDRDGWHAVDGLARPFVLLAVLRRARRTQESDPALSDDGALQDACAALGVEYETLRKRPREWAEQSIRKAA